MKITKLVNNNIVTSEDMQGREIIVMGRGLGFGKKPGMEIDVGKIEKVFRLSSEGENQKLVDYYTGYSNGTYHSSRPDH